MTSKRTIKLTTKNLKKLHIELWQWLVDHPGADKANWPRWEFNGGNIQYIISKCFACYRAELNPNSLTNLCSCCPIFIKAGRCSYDNSAFGEWEDLMEVSNLDEQLDNPEFVAKLKMYAGIIRDAWEE